MFSEHEGPHCSTGLDTTLHNNNNNNNNTLRFALGSLLMVSASAHKAEVDYHSNAVKGNRLAFVALNFGYLGHSIVAGRTSHRKRSPRGACTNTTCPKSTLVTAARPNADSLAVRIATELRQLQLQSRHKTTTMALIHISNVRGPILTRLCFMMHHGHTLFWW